MTVATPIVGEVGERIRASHVPVVDELTKVQGHPDVLHCQYNEEAAVSFEPRSVDIPAQEAGVALMALRARLAEKDAALRSLRDGEGGEPSGRTGDPEDGRAAGA